MAVVNNAGFVTDSAPIEAVLFDMGGVLVDFGGGGGLPPEAEDWRGRRAMLGLAEQVGSRDAHWREADLETRVFAPWRRDHDQRDRMGHEASWTPHLDRIREAYGCRLSDEELLNAWFRPYAEELSCCGSARRVVAEIVDRGMVCGLVSNVPLPGAVYRPVLGDGGLGPLLTVHCFSYDEGVRKPSPAIVRRALAALKVEPEAAVMVGDRRASDVAVGKTAGTRTVWLKSRFADGPEPDASIESLDQLPSVLAGWGAKGGDH